MNMNISILNWWEVTDEDIKIINKFYRDIELQIKELQRTTGKKVTISKNLFNLPLNLIRKWS